MSLLDLEKAPEIEKPTSNTITLEYWDDGDCISYILTNGETTWASVFKKDNPRHNLEQGILLVVSGS